MYLYPLGVFYFEPAYLHSISAGEPTTCVFPQERR